MTKTAKITDSHYTSDGFSDSLEEFGTIELIETSGRRRVIEAHDYYHAAERTYTLALITNLAAARGYTIVEATS